MQQQTPVTMTSGSSSMQLQHLQHHHQQQQQQEYTHVRTPFKRSNTTFRGMCQGGKKLRFATPEYEAITPPLVVTPVEKDTENVPPEMFIPFESV